MQRRNKSHKCKKTQNVVANYHSTCQRRNNVSASHSREAYVAFYRIFCLQFLPRLDYSIGIHILRSHPPECLTETDTQSTECTTCVAIDRIYAMWPNNLVFFSASSASSTTNAQFTPPARHDKTVLSVSCRPVWIESRDRLAKSEQLADRSPSSRGV